MSADIPIPHPRSAHLRADETKRLALGLVLARQGWTAEQWSKLLEQLRDACRELEIRHVEWVPPAEWPAEIEHA